MLVVMRGLGGCVGCVTALVTKRNGSGLLARPWLHHHTRRHFDRYTLPAHHVMTTTPYHIKTLKKQSLFQTPLSQTLITFPTLFFFALNLAYLNRGLYMA